MERFLQHVWLHRLYRGLSFSDKQAKIEIIDPGQLNLDAGPDFFNAKIKVDNLVFAGNVEIHSRASEWIRHGHHRDPAYDNVILHVVEKADQEVLLSSNKPPMLTATMTIGEQLRSDASYILTQGNKPSCLERLHLVPQSCIAAWLEVLTKERLRRKADEFERLISHTSSGDRNEATYILLARHMGFGINTDAFERLARHLPLRYIQKHRGNLLQIEALLLGTAGLLDIEERQEPNEYLALLKREYQFLAGKFAISSLPAHTFRQLRIRPASFPHLRLAQLAAILNKDERLYHRFIELHETKDLLALFDAETSPYWKTHYNFGLDHPTRPSNGRLSATSRHLLVANVVCPVLLVHSHSSKQAKYEELIHDILKRLPAENNRIVRSFQAGSLIAHSLHESQALVQLGTHYCQERRCFSCQIGSYLLSRSSCS